MTMTRDRIEELKRLAEKATQGEWTFFGKQNEIQIKDNVGCLLARMSWHHSNRYDYTLQEESVANAKFIAASNPQTILSLLALAERALEPQGQALPELPKPFHTVYDDIGNEEVPCYSPVQMLAYAHTYASQLALPGGPVPEGQLKEILGDLWDEGYVSPATYNDVDIRDPEERQRMRDHNVSEAQRRIAAALSSPSPAVAQPVPAGPVPATTYEMIELVKKRQSEVSAAAKRMEAGEPNGLTLMDLYRLGVMFSYMRVALKPPAVAQKGDGHEA